jgi:hypothetical protein
MPQLFESAVTGGSLLKGVAGRVEVTVYKDGTAQAATGTPTVTITRADGTALYTDEATTESAGVAYLDVTATDTSRVDTWTVALTGVWSGTTATFTHTVEVAGRRLFTLAQARTFDSADGSTGTMSSTTTYPAATILIGNTTASPACSNSGPGKGGSPATSGKRCPAPAPAN